MHSSDAWLQAAGREFDSRFTRTRTRKKIPHLAWKSWLPVVPLALAECLAGYGAGPVSMNSQGSGLLLRFLPTCNSRGGFHWLVNFYLYFVFLEILTKNMYLKFN